MTKLLLFLGLLFSFGANAMEYGECAARAQSKKYVEGNFHLPYPKTVSFTCAYDCKGENGVEEVIGFSEVRVSSIHDDGTKVVCQGVKVRFTGVYFQYLGTETFYAYDTNIPQVKKWAFKSVSRDNPLELEMLTELRDQLEEVGNSYIYVGANPQFAYFREAGNLLLEIASSLPQNTRKLDKAIEDYVNNGASFGSASMEGLVKSVLKSSASFRVPDPS